MPIYIVLLFYLFVFELLVFQMEIMSCFEVRLYFMMITSSGKTYVVVLQELFSN